MERFIDPLTLARVKDMPLIARTVADGFLHGLQQSHQRGIGVEFSQYRNYEPGDDPGRIDWKLFARSDRYFVREAERESEIGIWFVIDASASMKRVSETRPGAWNKFDYARHLLATLSYLAHRQGDQIGMLALSSHSQPFMPLAAGERQWHRMLKQLSGLESGATFPPLNAIRSAISRLQLPGMIFVISDFYQHSSEVMDFVRQIATAHTEVVGLQLQCEDELSFPYHGPVRFEDLESGEQVLVTAQNARESYQAALNRHQQSLRKALAQNKVSLNTINIDQPMDQALFDFLDSRRKVLR
jgi:uncharacterized protein (DUF58 family)